MAKSKPNDIITITNVSAKDGNINNKIVELQVRDGRLVPDDTDTGVKR